MVVASAAQDLPTESDQPMLSDPVDRLFPHVARATLLGLLSAAMVTATIAGPAPSARAATTYVSTAQQLIDQLAVGLGSLTLGADIVVNSDDLTVRANTTIDLNGKNLETRNILVLPTFTLTIDDPSSLGQLEVDAEKGPGIQTTDATLIINDGTITVDSMSGHAGIGGAEGSAASAGGDGGTTIINGGKVTVRGGGAGIGGGLGGNSATTSDFGGRGGHGGTTTITGGDVTVNSDFGAGIGGGEGGDSQHSPGGNGGNGGVTTISGGTLDSTGSSGAGIGGGAGGNTHGYTQAGLGGDGGTVTIAGGAVRATGGAGAGIGGGEGGPTVPGIGGDGGAGGTVTVGAGELIAIGEFGAGIGGGDGGWTPLPHVPGRHPGRGGAASNVSVETSAIVTASRTPSAASAVAIGPGDGIAAGSYSPMHLDGKLTLPAGQFLRVRAAMPPFYGHSNISGSGTIIGAGTIRNESIITAHVHDDVTVTGNNHYVTFDSGSSQASPLSQVVRVLAPNFVDGARSFPADPTMTSNNFEGWTVNADGTGGTPATTTTLSGHPTFYGQWEFPTFELAADDTTPFVGDSVSFTVTVEGGDPTADLSGEFTFTTDAPGADITGNEVAFTKPGGWIVAATHDASGLELKLPITASLNRNAPADLTLNLSATTVDVDDTITFHVTGTDAWGNDLGDFTDLATITSDHPTDAIGPGSSIHLTASNAHLITATIGGVSDSETVTVNADRTNPATISLKLSATSVDIGSTITATVTGADAWGNDLGDLTDLATITSDHPTDMIGADGSIRFPSASPHVITASIGVLSQSVTVTVIPAADGSTGLAGTGVEPLPLVGTALLLLLVGAALTVGLRRIRS